MITKTKEIFYLLLFISSVILFLSIIIFFKTNKSTQTKERNEFIYPFEPNKYKNELELNYQRLNKVPQIQINNSIDLNELRQTFHFNITQNKIFDENRIPFQFNFNILMTKIETKEELERFSQNEIDDLLDYKMMLLRMYYPKETNDFLKIKHQMNEIENLFRLYRSYYFNHLNQIDNNNNDDNKKEEIKQQNRIEIPNYCNNRIDIVWTYVNGTEKHWKETFLKFNKKYKYEHSRFHDYGTLKYSMRSVYENVPFDIHWHLIVQDEYQIPSFLNKTKLIFFNDTSTKNSLRIIYHRDIFPDISVLPTFNSDAIEASMYNMKGVNECFIYLNDDFLINSPIDVSDIFSEDGRIKVYQSTQLPMPRIAHPIKWHQTITFSHELFNTYYSEDNIKRYVISHQMYFLRKSVLKKLNEIFSKEFEYSRNQRFRNDKDTAMPFLHGNYMIREGYGKGVFEHSSQMIIIKITENSMKNKEEMNHLKLKNIPFVVLNDEIKKSFDKNENIENDLIDILNDLYDKKTCFEL